MYDTNTVCCFPLGVEANTLHLFHTFKEAIFSAAVEVPSKPKGGILFVIEL
jgi:hypothetical protein